jgi:hypothetical protein
MKKMKTVTPNNSGTALDLAKRIMFLTQVLIVGLFIPFSFVFGITYNRHEDVAKKSININKPNQAISGNTTVDLGRFLSDKNS